MPLGQKHRFDACFRRLAAKRKCKHFAAALLRSRASEKERSFIIVILNERSEVKNLLIGLRSFGKPQDDKGAYKRWLINAYLQN